MRGERKYLCAKQLVTIEKPAEDCAIDVMQIQADQDEHQKVFNPLVRPHFANERPKLMPAGRQFLNLDLRALKPAPDGGRQGHPEPFARRLPNEYVGGTVPDIGIVVPKS